MISIIGAGGHAQVVLDALLEQISSNSVKIYDQEIKRKELMGIRIIDMRQHDIPNKSQFHVAVGSNYNRCQVAKKYIDMGCGLYTVVHKRAIVSTFSHIREGAFLAAGSITGPNALVGVGSIINHNAVIDHECLIGDYVHVAPNVTLGGNVAVGDRSFIGAGATVLPGVRIGSGVIVGAGAVVTRDVDNDVVVKGVPAK